MLLAGWATCGGQDVHVGGYESRWISVHLGWT
jgi:hypothetical protein